MRDDIRASSLPHALATLIQGQVVRLILLNIILALLLND